jgi:copper resistance protein B
MNIITKSMLMGLGFMSLFTSSLAQETDLNQMQHDNTLFHMVRIEAGGGASDQQSYQQYDLDAWWGSDEHKLWVKSEGRWRDGHADKQNIWALYSRNISTFWDLQMGLRVDDQPKSSEYLVLGVEGLAPYFFETEAHLMLGKAGDNILRLKQRNDFLFTQRLILQPYFELTAYSQSNASIQRGEGISEGELGMQLRYEITRGFAPYIDVRYERKFGQTADFARHQQLDVDNWLGQIGLRLMF